ncbi:MAG: RHS repeat protein, partial [Bacteroidales bacterium]|nr:RHS repeat protein [Bacteroidales bacterium]
MALFSSPVRAQESSLSIRENSLFTDGVNMPASPQALGMNRYGNENINLYTGTVGANIPIYRYRDNDFTIPVSINYSSDGYRPNIQNGPVGLGWNLDLGGAVTREVRGIPDDTPATSDLYHFRDKFTGNSLNESSYGPTPDVYGYAYYCRDYDLSQYSYSDNLVYSGKLGEEYMFVKEEWELNGGSSMTSTGICYEAMPDIFHFSGPGVSGRFVLQPGGGAVFYDTEGSPSGYEVSYELGGSGFVSIEITTHDRYTYTYEQVDMCTSISQLADANDNVTVPGSWRLTRIEAPDGRYVTFTYNERNVTQSSQHVRSLDWSDIIPRDEDPDGRNSVPPSSSGDSGTSKRDSLVSREPVSDGKRSGRSSSSGGEGVTWSETASDCLTQVKVCNANGTVVCTITLSYVNGVVENGATSAYCKKLSQLTVKNINGTTVRHCTLSYDVVYDAVATTRGVTFLSSLSIDGEGTTSFSYYGNDANAITASTSFPEMTTLEVDWYGFYNPTVTSATFAPTMQAAQSSTSDTWLLTLRQPHLAGTRLGMLRSITYPTGGSATYEYELNTHSQDLTGLNLSSNGTTSGLRVKSVTLKDRDGNPMQKRSFLYGSSLQSTGRLLRRPAIYIYYKLESSGFTRLEHRSLSTTSDLFYGVTPHVEYSSVTERITRDGSSDVCEIDYSFSSCADGENGNSYGSYSREYDSMSPVFFCSHLDNDQRVESLFQTIRQVQDYAGGGKVLSREEYTVVSGSRRPVRSDGFLYTPMRNSYPVDYTSKTFCLSLNTDYTYRFNSPRLTWHSVTEYAPGGTAIKELPEVIRYDSLQRPVRVSTIDSEGDSLSTRYTWDTGKPWVLKEKSSYRGELMISGVQYGWQRPNASTHPDWYVPSTLSKAAIILEHFEDEGSDPWDETTATWYQVASFSGYNAAGNPTTVTDAMGHTTGYSWDSSLLNLASVTTHPNGNSGSSLVTSWTWLPLVGVTSITTPGGKTRRYTYDSYGRLIATRNTGNNTLEQYSYLVTSDEYSWTKVRTYRTSNIFADDITYYNGLGYPIEVRSVDHTAGYDLGTAFTYDALMREPRKWLP